MDGTQEGTGDGGIGIRVAARHHRLHHACFQAGGVEQLIEGILQGNQRPALVLLVVVGRSISSFHQRLGHGFIGG